MPARNARVLDPPTDDLVPVPLFAQLSKRAALALRGLSGAAHAQGVLLLVEQHTGLPRLDAGLCKRHGRVVADGQPMLAATEVIAQRPRGATASLLAQIQPIAVTEQHPLARSVRPFHGKRSEFRAFHPTPPSQGIDPVVLDLGALRSVSVPRKPQRSSNRSYRVSYISATRLATG